MFWSEVVRRAIYEVIVCEEARMRGKDLNKIKRAAIRSELLSDTSKDGAVQRRLSVGGKPGSC